jgi:Ni/Co efflux regulator RcnB
MKQIHVRTAGALTIALAVVLASSPTLADDDKRGSGKDQRGYQHRKHDGGQDDHRGKRDDDGDDRRWSRNEDGRYHFSDEHRVFVRDYYVKRGCPPGLAKKHNHCMPPGQTRAWKIGQRLPPDVIFYDVPQPLVLQFGAPPIGYRYVRVASDILLLAVGTGMVMDAIQNLGGM